MTQFEPAAARSTGDTATDPAVRRRAGCSGRSAPFPTADGPVLAPAILLILALAAPPALPAQADNGWIGKRVVQKYRNFQLRIENQVIDPKEIVTYRVEQVNGPWLRVKAEGRGLGGWARADHVVPVEQAIAFFTDSIRANPADAFGYQMRATIWRERKEIDIALGDLNEAIRLNPADAALWNTRGVAWRDKKEYDKAIADYGEAIRLDPNFAAYNNRGNAWRDKKEYDKAIADYGEAIRLDPKNAFAYNTRGLAWRDKEEYDKAIADYDEAIRLDPKYPWAYSNRALTLLLARREGGAESARAGLEIAGWRGEEPIYTVIAGHLAAVQGGKGDRAKAFLDDAAARCDRETWPYPIVKYLRGELDEAGLLAAATDDDKRTEVHGYVGVAQLLKGRQEAAREHFRWVKEHGNPAFVEYTMATAELERLGAEPRAASRP